MVKEGDFVEVTYTGTVEGDVFDTTDATVAKEQGFKQDVKPIVLCIGKNAVLKGLEEDMNGKDVGKEYSVTLAPENAFGKKNAKLIQLIPTSKFKKEGMNPYPGLQVQIDGQVAVVKRVSGGRTLVDFNHPLAGRDVTYTYTITKEITDPSVKLTAMVPGETSVKDGVAKIPEFPENMRPELEKQIKESIPEITKVEYVAAKNANKGN